MKKNLSNAGEVNRLLGTVAHLATLNAIAGGLHEPAFDGRGAQEHHGLVSHINASMLTEGNFQQELTTYATGWKSDLGKLERELAFFMPSIQVARRFEYAQMSNPESLASDPDEDLRSIGSDFAKVELSESKVQAKTESRGLQIIVDRDQVSGSAWEERKVAYLTRRLKRNKLRRAIALLSAAANNTAKTWDDTAGKDPDQDVKTQLITAANKSGLRPNKVAYGDTAFSYREASHRAQDTAGGYASAALTEEQLAAALGVDDVLRSRSRYTATASTKTEVLSNLVLMFMASEFADEEDASNIVDFYSPVEGGGQFAVYLWEPTPKTVAIAVEHHEKIVVPTTLGIEKLTVSKS